MLRRAYEKQLKPLYVQQCISDGIINVKWLAQMQNSNCCFKNFYILTYNQRVRGNRTWSHDLFGYSQVQIHIIVKTGFHGTWMNPAQIIISTYTRSFNPTVVNVKSEFTKQLQGSYKLQTWRDPLRPSRYIMLWLRKTGNSDNIAVNNSICVGSVDPTNEA